MAPRKLPPELGQLVLSHRPVHRVLGWGIIAALSLPFALMASFMAPGPLVGLAILAGFGIPLTYALAEMLLLKHDLYEHGMVLRSIPGLNAYVVPHCTIDPDRVTVGQRHLNRSGNFEAPDRRYRQCPFVKETIDFGGLDPKYAAWLGKDKVSWQAVGRWDGTRAVNPAGAPIAVRVWRTSWRDAARHRDLIETTVRASQRHDDARATSR